MTPLPLEFRDLLKSFNDQGLKYLVVGGWAVAHHGYRRYTADIDFWIAVSPENADRLIAALKKFIGTAPSKNSIIKERKMTEFGRPPLLVQILCDISGVEFEACYSRRVQDSWEGVEVSVISFKDLLANKRSAARHKDLADVDRLTKMTKLARRKKK
jgi:hypothetical protein